jgi:hypothetical protein
MVNSSSGPLIVPFGLELVHITSDFPQAVCSACHLLLVSCLAFPSTLNMEAICSSETSGYPHTKQHYNPEDCTLHSHCCRNLRSNKKFVFFLITVIFTKSCSRVSCSPASYLGGLQFKYRFRDSCPDWGLSWFSSVSPRKCRDSTSN